MILDQINEIYYIRPISNFYIMLLTVFLITIVLVALAFAGLGVNILFRKNGKFPQTEVGSNKNIKNLGITCTKQDEMKMYRQERKSGTPATQPPMRDCGIGCSCVSDEF
ncbi:MAG: hypothetical protein D4R64_08250 [Porphyromonadaceae bacterium]|nr:MAG: hypothetical protein D4R64_08250 [Porphyromonadaceae bacterium]